MTAKVKTKSKIKCVNKKKEGRKKGKSVTINSGKSSLNNENTNKGGKKMIETVTTVIPAKRMKTRKKTSDPVLITSKKTLRDMSNTKIVPKKKSRKVMESVVDGYGSHNKKASKTMAATIKKYNNTYKSSQKT